MSADRDALRLRLRALFLDELDEHVLILNRGLVALEQDPAGAGTADLVNELFRSAHSLKGAAQAAAVEPVAALCHGLEAALAGVRDGKAEIEAGTIDPLLKAVDEVAAAGRRLRGEDDAEDENGAEVEDEDEVVPAPGPSSNHPARAGIRMPAARLEALLDRAGEMVSACAGMHAVVAEASSPEAAAADRVLTSAQQALTDAVRQAGMVPFSEACTRLDRVARDVATAAGKQARLVVDGGAVEMDRPIMEGLREPLLHLVRNAVDHGVEAPDVRVEAGKEPAGTVTLAASVEGARVVVTVSDDGGGIDTEGVRTAAARRGIVGAAGGDGGLSDLVFTPGVSTAPLLTDVSGRGVGLDAVRAGVEALGGSVGIHSTPGSGTSVTLVLPITRSIARVVLVDAGGETVALPVADVVRMARVRIDDVRVVDERTMVLLGERLVPAAWLSDVMGTQAGRPAPGAVLDVVVVDTPGGEAVLVVDELVEEQETVIKPAPARLEGSPGVVGATILTSGRVVLVLNPAAALRLAGGTARPLPHAAGDDADDAPARPRRVLLVDDTLTTRTLERSILETAGYEVVVAVDGEQALDLLRTSVELDVDAVVSDVNMPRMDGLTLCEAVRSSTRFGRLPVVLVTSLASDEDRRRGAEAGADAYIAKSEFDQSMLLDTLARLL